MDEKHSLVESAGVCDGTLHTLTPLGTVKSCVWRGGLSSSGCKHPWKLNVKCELHNMSLITNVIAIKMILVLCLHKLLVPWG